MFFLVTLTNFNIDIGFSLKPFMIFSFIYLLMNLSKFEIKKLYWYEIVLIVFHLYYCYTGVFAKYPESSVRVLFGFTILLGCYFIMKHAMTGISVNVIERAIGISGVLFNSVSLLLYILGLSVLNFQFQGDRIKVLGVMLDRDYPRLIGTVPDPNFYIFYNTLFFTYFLCKRNSLLNKAGLLLCILTNILTFSRGGLLAVTLIVILYFFMNNPVTQIKLFFGFLTSFTIIGYVVIFYLKFDVMRIIESRINDFSQDGGSGRFVLWERAWDYFSSNVWLGIGAFNFPDYNELHYGEYIHVHNMFLDILAESGIIGFALFIVFIITLGVEIMKKKVIKANTYLFLSLLAIIFQMMSLTLIINEMLFMYLAIVAVLISIKSKSFTTLESSERRSYEKVTSSEGGYI